MRPSLIRSGAACFRALDRKGFQASGNRLGEGGRYAGSGRVRLGRPSPVGGPIRCPPPPPVRHALPAQVEAFTRPRSSPRRPAARGPCCRAGRPSARGRTKTVDKGSGNLRHATCPSASSGTPTERPPPLARHAATDRSSIEPDREGLGTKHALSPTASLPSGQAHQGLAAGADGLRQEVRPRLQPTTAFALLSRMQRAVDTSAQPVFPASSRPAPARRRRHREDVRTTGLDEAERSPISLQKLGSNRTT